MDASIPLIEKAISFVKYTFFPREAVNISSSLKLHKVLPNAENVIYLKKRKIDTTKRKVIAKKETLFSIGKPKTYVFFKA